MKRYYDDKNKKLIYFGKKATSDFWDDHWGKKITKEKIVEEKEDVFILRTLLKYIPSKKGRILEGGCGIGSKVYCMHAHGYRVIGVDFARKTIEQVKKIIPKLDLRIDNVRDLSFSDDFFISYWSIGVIEHFWDGYGVILKEMKRVLVNNGYVFIDFPYMSPLRNLKSRLGLYKEYSKEIEFFYQFALDKKKVIEDFEELGFKLLKKQPLGGIKGLKDEIFLFKRFLKPLLQKLYDYHGNNFLIVGLKYILEKILPTLGTGHKIFLVFRNVK